MRPIRLEVKGFTCFRDRAVLDFSGRDLFAITGPTGSGKSSLIDAMTYALYGRSSRAERDKKDCIAQGMASAEVGFEFVCGSGASREQYRVARALKRAGAPNVTLHRLDGADWVSVASGDRPVTEHVARAVGLDFDGFTRAVVLPQNEFDRFLSGKADERRRILNDLLNLGVYDRIRKRADDMQKADARDAEALRVEIEQHYQDATEETLIRLQDEYRVAQETVVALRGRLGKLDDATRIGSELATARQRHATAAQALAEAQDELADAVELLRGGERELQELDERIALVDARLSANAYDDGLLALLNRALPLAQAVAERDRERQALSAEAEVAGRAAEEGTRQEEECRSALDGAERALSEANRLLEEARRLHAAADLQRSLRPGEPCPVCAQTVVAVPGQSTHPDLDAAEGRRDRAASALEEAQQALARAQVTAAKQTSRLLGLQEQLDRCLAAQSAVTRELGELAGARVPRDIEGIAALLDEQEAARAERTEASEERERLERQREDLAGRIAEARSDAAILEERVKAVAEDASEAEAAARAAIAGLDDVATALSWPELTRAAVDGDPSPLIAARRNALAREHDAAVSRAALLGDHVARVREGIPVRRRKEEQIEALEAKAAVAQDLAALLARQRFLTYVEEAALKILAQDGSARLEELSGGRYSFAVDNQVFLVVDHWNADETRPVSTLSGGETFLASLGLAEALAERMPDLAVGRGRSSLESLFIDEGFGSLDEGSLDAVAQALESLRAKNRVVCIITHVRPLAERMPARVEVIKSERGSSLAPA